MNSWVGSRYSKAEIVTIFFSIMITLKTLLIYKFVDVDQLNQILAVLGTPDDATLSRIGSERVNSVTDIEFDFSFLVKKF